MPVVQPQLQIEHSRPRTSQRQVAFITYFFALCLGVGLTAYALPAHVIFSTDILAHPMLVIDAAMQAEGQRYFVNDSWRWPLFLTRTLAAPHGTNMAFMDCVPLITVLMKIFRHWLPHGFQSITLWLAICWVLQPVAAVFALRSAGEKRILPNLAMALFAVSMPTFIYRVGHAALSSHFLILIALGLYFRITQDTKKSNLLAAGLLILVALLTNPYIMYMVIAVLAAAPLSLLLRRDRMWIPAAIGIGTAIGITAGIALLLGYGHAIPMYGFGVYSMNLLSPIYPSTAMIGQPNPTIDATGGQHEGFQFLGLGLILLLLIADFLLGPRDRIALLRRHAGLVLACIGLFVLALSNKIYAGNHLLLHYPAPSIVMELRASGRMFWPVTYTLLMIGVLIVCKRTSARVAGVLLMVLAALQYVESSPMRRWVRHQYRVQQEWVLDTSNFRPLLATHKALVVWPTFGCGGDQNTRQFSQLLFLASEVVIPVNTTFTGRLTSVPNCDLPQFPITVAPGEMWVFVPKAPPATVMSVVDWRDICREITGLAVCAQDLRGRTDLPIPTAPTIPLATALSTATAAPGVQALVGGWFDPEVWGVWGEGSGSDLIANVDRPAGQALKFTVVARGVPPSNDQKVTVIANGVPVANWDLVEGTAEYSAIIPPSSRDNQPIRIEFDFQNSFNPPFLAGLPVWFRNDRKLGMGLISFRFDPVEHTQNKAMHNHRVREVG